MSFVCAISGEVPLIPVVSLVSKNVFEKRLLEKFILTNGKDPITGQPMSINDILEIKTVNNVVTRKTDKCSVPELLKCLQNEWDSFALKLFEMSEMYENTKKELSLCQYELDAAKRVIAKLHVENNYIKNGISDTLQAPIIQNSNEVNTDKEEIKSTTILSSEICQKLQEYADEMISERKIKNKKVPVGIPNNSDLKKYNVTFSRSDLHAKKDCGILCLDIRNHDDFVVTGGNDKTVVCFDHLNNSSFQYKGHTKKVSNVLFHQKSGLIYSGSFDSTIRIWQGECRTCKSIIKHHKSPILSMNLHPTNDYLFSLSADTNIVLTDIESESILVKHDLSSMGISPTICQSHPDGLIYAVGTIDGKIYISDIKSFNLLCTFEHDNSNINSIAFSPNGYILTSCSSDNTIKWWDLRKLKDVRTINFSTQNLFYNHITFDNSGLYLGAGGSQVTIYDGKNGETVATFEDNKSAISCVKFGLNSNYFVSSSTDGYLRFYSNK